MDEKQVRLTSEKTLQHDTFKLKLGTTNKNNPEVVYFEGRVFISPNKEKDSYTKDIKSFKYSLQKSIREQLCNNNHFQNNYILDFQIADSGIKVNKKSFLTFELICKQPVDRVLKLGDVKKNAEKNIYEIVNTLQKSIIQHDFSLSKTKK